MTRWRLATQLAILLLAHGRAHAGSLVVPDQFPTIQSAITAASSGDTILVRPGTYSESLTWANKDLVVMGGGAADSIVITTNSTARVLTLGPGITNGTVLRNLSFRVGLADVGGGLKLVAASPVVQHCRFESNVASQEPDYPKGGAVFVDPGSRLVIEDCFLGSNRAEAPWPQVDPPGFGGAIFVAAQGVLEVRRCTFQENVAYGFEGGVGGGICVDSSASAVIDSCTFLGNAGYGGGVFSWGHITVSRCRFDGNHGWTGAAIYIPYGTYVIEHSIFYDNDVLGNEGGTIVANTSGQITNNTVAFNFGVNDYAGIDAWRATTTRNIISQNRGWGIVQCSPFGFSCNDVWGNEINGAPANYECGDMTGVNENVSIDPLFCAPESRDFSLHANSPCAAGPDTCGLIGALDIGCGVAALVDNGQSPYAVLRLLSPQPIISGSVLRLVIELPEDTTGRVAIYSAAGRCVEVLGEGVLTCGRHEFAWRAPRGRVPSGIYYVALMAAKWRLSTPVVLL